jgi:hypothetical protein
VLTCNKHSQITSHWVSEQLVLQIPHTVAQGYKKFGCLVEPFLVCLNLRLGFKPSLACQQQTNDYVRNIPLTLERASGTKAAVWGQLSQISNQPWVGHKHVAYDDGLPSLALILEVLLTYTGSICTKVTQTQ